MILIYANGISGQIGMQPTIAEGRQAPARVYDIVNHWVEVDGTGINEVAQQDAEEICRLPGYRLALPIEQTEYQKAKRKSSRLVEKMGNVAVVEEDNGGQ